MTRKTKSAEPAAASFSRTSGLAAIGFATMIVLGNVILVPAGLPHGGARPEDVVAFFSTQSGVLGLASALTPAAWALATVFGAGAVAAARRSEPGRGDAWSLVGFAGLVLQNATFTGLIAVRFALAAAAPHDAATTAVFWTLHQALLSLNGTFLALALVGLTVSGRRAGLLRRWHAAIGMVAAALQFTSATLTPLIVTGYGLLGLIGLTGWLIWVVWLVAYGVRLIRARPEHAVD
ncbi:hypothetical protein [Allonocardiopsis opalescens]|uniref:DUF4386 family protein n=1 Tax=Allonocardiopsis opalescens TaxID=1144618 RepID=A0A2T0PYU3_9ACTN|nr:hypothetical protein [Allonocardiopsis opalescens]PRX96704.1 hypothetical protein CLV72_107227 [Allonocardiopsis opalescens]